MQLALRSTGMIVGLAPLQNRADTTAAWMHHDMAWRPVHYGGWRIAGGVIWLGVVIYGLILATRFVRAVERLADRLPPR